MNIMVDDETNTATGLVFNSLSYEVQDFQEVDGFTFPRHVKVYRRGVVKEKIEIKDIQVSQ